MIRKLAARFLTRHETRVDPVANFKSGIGAALAMGVVGLLASLTGLPLLLAPLGATAALLFGQPSSPLAQPVNVMFGYLVGALICEAVFLALPGVWVAAAVAVGITIVVMRALRATHPPACALPILTFGEPIHGLVLFTVLLVGCVAIISLAVVVHGIPPKRQYPLHPD